MRLHLQPRHSARMSVAALWEARAGYLCCYLTACFLKDLLRGCSGTATNVAIWPAAASLLPSARLCDCLLSDCSVLGGPCSSIGDQQPSSAWAGEKPLDEVPPMLLLWEAEEWFNKTIKEVFPMLPEEHAIMSRAPSRTCASASRDACPPLLDGRQVP